MLYKPRWYFAELPSDEAMSASVIAAIVVGSFCSVLLLAILTYLVMRRSPNAKVQPQAEECKGAPASKYESEDMPSSTC